MSITAALLAALPHAAFAQQAAGLTPLSGGRPRWARAGADLGPVPSDLQLTSLRLFLRQSPAQAAALQALLRAQRDPRSPRFQHWLTPEEYAAQFGAPLAVLNSLSVWLNRQGFAITAVARGRNWIRFRGTAGQAEAAFHTALHSYRTQSGEARFAAAAAPQLPASLAGVVAGIEGLNEVTPAPGIQEVRQRLAPQFDSGGAHQLAPAVLAAIYDFAPLWSQGIDGKGVSIAVVGESDFNPNDINDFRSTFGLAPAKVTTLVAAGSADPGFTGAETEADLDLEWAGGVAPEAQLIYVADVNAFDAVAYAIDQDLAPVVSESFGTCELNVTTAGAAAFEAEVLQGNVEGITMVNGSGDSGAADCDAKAEAEVSHGLAVHYPASIPEVTAVGGTEFDEGAQTDWGANAAQGGSAMGYIPEMVWNDHAAFAARGLARLASGGGGISVLYPQPLWQQGVSQASATQRLVPDIAFTASAFHDPYIVCSEAATPCTGAYPPASFTEIGGASAPTPMFAGILALLNQYRLSHGFATAPGLGNINPKLYALAQAGSGVWHDVTLGNNREPCTAGTPDCTSGVTVIGYCAGPGYDTVTGLGSLDAAQLARQWDGTPATSAPGILVGACDPAATVSAGQTASFPVAVAASGGLSGTAQLSCTGAPAGAVCTVSPASVTLSGTSAAATVTVSTTAGSWAAPWGKLPNRRWPLGWGATLLILAASLYLAKRRHGPLATAASLGAVILAVALAACGGGSSGGTVTPPPPPNPATPAGSYTLTVTATSGSHAGSVNLGLTVN